MLCACAFRGHFLSRISPWIPFYELRRKKSPKNTIHGSHILFEACECFSLYIPISSTSWNTNVNLIHTVNGNHNYCILYLYLHGAPTRIKRPLTLLGCLVELFLQVQNRIIRIQNQIRTGAGIASSELCRKVEWAFCMTLAADCRSWYCLDLDDTNINILS